MSRLAKHLASGIAPSLTVLIVASAGLSISVPKAMAADWGTDFGSSDDFRGSYSNEPKDWSGLNDPNDEVGLEFGMRYWYSMGDQKFTSTGNDFENKDTSSILEGHLRIDDQASRSYGKAIIGYSAAINGSYSPIGNGDGAITDGRIGYAGADIGWNTFGDGRGSGIGLFAGYQYWNDSPRTERSDYTTAKSADDVTYDQDTGQVFLPFDSSDSNIDIHALRLGVSGKAKFGDMFDISAEVAAVPYAKVHGVLGGAGFDPEMNTPLGNYSFVKSSETTIDGWGYGAMGEVMLGITPVENLTFRVGGRAWYLNGTVDSTYTALSLTDPSDSDTANPPKYDTAPTVTNQGYIETSNPFSLFRAGLLAEMTYSF